MLPSSAAQCPASIHTLDHKRFSAGSARWNYAIQCARFRTGKILRLERSGKICRSQVPLPHRGRTNRSRIRTNTSRTGRACRCRRQVLRHRLTGTAGRAGTTALTNRRDHPGPPQISSEFEALMPAIVAKKLCPLISLAAITRPAGQPKLSAPRTKQDAGYSNRPSDVSPDGLSSARVDKISA